MPKSKKLCLHLLKLCQKKTVTSFFSGHFVYHLDYHPQLFGTCKNSWHIFSGWDNRRRVRGREWIAET